MAGANAADAAVLLKACQELLLHRLSSSSGGDPGMVFDESDAATERKRKGTVTFDRTAVNDFQAVVKREANSAMLRLIDGMPPQKAYLVDAPAKLCVHGCCAAHGSGPFPCCRCGATWEAA